MTNDESYCLRPAHFKLGEFVNMNLYSVDYNKMNPICMHMYLLLVKDV